MRAGRKPGWRHEPCAVASSACVGLKRYSKNFGGNMNKVIVQRMQRANSGDRR